MMKLTLYFFLFLLSACSTHKPSSIDSSTKEIARIDELAKEKFGDNYFIVENATNKYALVKSKTKKFSEIGFDISYFIFDNQSNEIILEDFLKSGYVDWIDNHIIKAVNRKIGQDNKRNKEVYQYNVETRVRIDL